MESLASKPTTKENAERKFKNVIAEGAGSLAGKPIVLNESVPSSSLSYSEPGKVPRGRPAKTMTKAANANNNSIAARLRNNQQQQTSTRACKSRRGRDESKPALQRTVVARSLSHWLISLAFMTIVLYNLLMLDSSFSMSAQRTNKMIAR